MVLMVLGLVLFFSVHSLKTVHKIQLPLLKRMGENPYKAVYSILSLAGLVLIGFGFADYRSDGLIPV
ncbi:MAG: NnrU family protein, partial [Burkholderiales bacterium]|nr:NnrU family protein [Burkholderiales bacterium]